MLRAFCWLAVGALLAAAALATTDRELPPYDPHAVELPRDARYRTATGAVAIVGYNDMAEMLAALGAKFTATHPGVAFALELKGTRTAPPALGTGRSLFAPMGAEFSARELADYRAATGGDPLPFRIAHASLDPRALSGPLAIFVHKDNPLTALSLDELAGIFSGAKPAHGLQPAGLAPDAALGLFVRDRVLHGAEFAPGFTGFRQSADAVRHVAAHPDAIGFGGAVRTNDGVKILALAAKPGDTPVALTAENLVAGRYPLDRHLLISVRQPIDPIAREFLRLVFSREGQAIIAGGTLGYLPLSAPDAAVERVKLDAR